MPPPPSMESLFQVQSKFRQDMGLRKIKVIHNKNYKASGTKSYVYLLNRFGFNPTKPGRYHQVHEARQRGLASGGEHARHGAVGGRVNMVSRLVKKEHPATPADHAKDQAAQPAQTGQVTAEDQQNDSEYLCQVPIGTPAQTLLLDFDTGSSDLWVFSTSLPAATTKNHTAFDPTKSSTFKAMPGYAWQITYGDQSSASGTCGTDTVTLGGLAIEGQCVELASKLSAQFSQGTGDGLLGLAWPSINTVTHSGSSAPQATPVANMITQKDIPAGAELFTSAFYSTRDTGAPESFYTFGYIDQDLVTASGAQIAWTPIDNSQGFWMFPSTSAVINGTTVSVAGNTAIADTGTTLALLSDTVVEALYKAIPGATYSSDAQGYIFPNTTSAASLPTFSVAVGDTQFTIQPEDLAFAPADSNNWYGAVQSRGDNPFDILGDAFLKSVYAIWDQGNQRFGAVPKIQATQNLTPSS